jgi:hypothetical protein
MAIIDFSGGHNLLDYPEKNKGTEMGVGASDLFFICICFTYDTAFFGIWFNP